MSIKSLLTTLLIIGFFSHRTSAMNASLDIYRFEASNSPYIDVYLRILASSVSFVQGNKSTLNANVEVLMMVKKGEVVVSIEKFSLNASGMDERKDLLDRKRFGLKPDLYTLEVIITDINDSLNKFHVAKIFKVEEMKSDTHFSDIQLLSKVESKNYADFSKNGLYLEPMPFSLVNETNTTLSFYTELYNANADTTQEYTFYYAIFPFEDSSFVTEPFIKRYKKYDQQKTTIFVNSLEVGKLTSGDYLLRVAIIDKNKKALVSMVQPFICDNIPADLAYARNYNKSVANSFVSNLDSARIEYCLKAMNPIMPANLFNTYEEVRKGENYDAKRYLLLKYWTNKYPKSPETSFIHYMKVAEFIDKEYNSNFGKGFQTDRGFTFLKYGKPNKIIEVEDEPNTPPYEIWFYAYVESTSQNNVKFIFYNPSLAPNDYQLLHSTCYGSRQNPAWEVQLYKNSPDEVDGDNNINATRMKDNWQRRARKLFEDI